MRRAIHDFLDTPWGFRITCGVLFVIVMGLARYGLHVLLESSDRSTFLMFCGCALVVLFLFGWLYDRHNARAH